MNQQFRYGENDIFFQNAQNAGAVFPPAGCFCLLNCVAQKHDNVRCGLGPWKVILHHAHCTSQETTAMTQLSAQNQLKLQERICQS